MNFIQRTANLATSVFWIYFRKWFVLPRIDVLVQEMWNDTMPAVKEIEDRASLFITNTHPTTNYHYFKTSNIVEAGGLHLQVPPNKLPKVGFYLKSIPSIHFYVNEAFRMWKTS